MRTQGEIAAFISGTRDSDPFGFVADLLTEYLDAEHIGQFCKPSTVPADLISKWQHREPSEANVLEDLKAYVPFGWEKALGHRGISANRTFQRLRAWVWLLENDELFAFAADDEHYAQYGAPLLMAVCNWYKIPIPGDGRAERMAKGQPCRPDCRAGCGI